MTPAKPPMAWAKYAVAIAPFVLVFLTLVVWLAVLLYDRAGWSEEADQASVREWLDETRPFRRTLPELAREYAQAREAVAAGNALPGVASEKRAELDEQLRALMEPTRVYESKLPGFPLVYRLGVTIPGSPVETVEWTNPQPRPREQNRSRVQTLAYRPYGDEGVEIACDYQFHAFNKLQRRDEERRRESMVAGAVLIAATLIAGLFVYRFLRHERKRETERLQRQLDAAQLEHRADSAEKAALEAKTQLYAGIGILAGSYAHNIKNLLVRPNDLLRRCVEAARGQSAQETMLGEIQGTLGTVTERLEEILRTVRRDPTRTETTPVDLGKLVRDTVATWGDTARDKWKVNITGEVSPGDLVIPGDPSHLHQAVENLLFNARDASFEMRNHFREAARRAEGDERKRLLLESAAWKGEVLLRARREGTTVILEVTDNGIGMDDAVRERCLETHFSTKRDNALYEGYSAGMGLGLSFVAMVLDRHGAKLEIDSAPLRGATFRARFG